MKTTSAVAKTVNEIDEALAGACARIAPTWPLDRFIAVNPFWERTARSLPAVSAELGALSGTRLLMPLTWFHAQWRAGAFEQSHLEQAIRHSGSPVTVEKVLARFESEVGPTAPRLRVMDVADQSRDLVHQMPWRDFITHSLSQFCASYFDEAQAQLRPSSEGGLYATWRRHALDDQSPRLLMGLKQHGALVEQLPHGATEMSAMALEQLDVPAAERESYLYGLLLDLNGWASWCAYQQWTGRLSGRTAQPLLQELLAIRLAWEWMLLRDSHSSLVPRWQLAMAAWKASDVLAHDAQHDDWHFQSALELAFQQRLVAGFFPVSPAPLAGSDAPREVPEVQAVFCIDVRSEVMRRALEAVSPGVQTIGFAGFFGMPLEYLPLGGSGTQPHLPGLLAPRLQATDTGASPGATTRRHARLDLESAWRGFKGGASSFSFVDSMGLSFAAQLLRDTFSRAGRSPRPLDAGLDEEDLRARKPRLTGAVGGPALDLEGRAGLAAGILRGMGLTQCFAPVVALIGHGSQTRNNPHAASLDCGACCGQTGEVSARATAALLNEPEVRARLSALGITVPPSTRFIAGLHDTTTDEIELFELDELPSSHAARVEALRVSLRGAGDRARAERATRLNLGHLAGDDLRAAITGRAADWAEVRPEWGLANNAAFIAAPRERTRALNLEGRAFLHDYRFTDDPDLSILELIMTAPLVVAHWINLQYYASTVDNVRYGSGNKVLHNVVGGHLGVFEGNGGDLRIGLPMQSVHDGSRWVHTPLRLNVFLEAPVDAIDRVLAAHGKVRELVDNEWLYLFQLDAAKREVKVRRGGAWVSAH